MRKIFLFLFLQLIPFMVFAAPSDEIAAIQKDLQHQITTWNQNDIKSFMTSYKNSDETMYGSAASPHMTSGYQNIQNRYYKFLQSEQWGKATMSNVKIKLLSPKYAYVTGNWHLANSKGNTSGIFTSLYEKTPEGWKIIIDHDS